MDLKEQLERLPGITLKKHVDRRLIYALGIFGAALIIAVLWLAYADWRGSSKAAAVETTVDEILQQLHQPVDALKRTLEDERVQSLAVRAIENPDSVSDLRAYLNGRIPRIGEVMVFPRDLSGLQPSEIGPNGFALLDMALSAVEHGRAGLQYHASAEPPRLAEAIAVEVDGKIHGVLIVTLEPEYLLEAFKPGQSGLGFARLEQFNGRQPPNNLRESGDSRLAGEVPNRRAVPGTLLRIAYPLQQHVSLLPSSTMFLLFFAGILCVAGALALDRSNRAWAEANPEEAEPRRAKAMPDPRPRLQVVRDRREPSVAREPEAEPVAKEDESRAGDEKQTEEETADPVPPEPPPMRLHYDVAARRRRKEAEHEPVELSEAIFRAYDIRGIIDKTLDSGIARQVGQSIGTAVLEKEAGPVVVARDGRLSGSYLQEGMMEGILSTGCDVLDIGAVPTGVLYFAAHAKAAGSGVMITGSHNPPDYNGFKIMIGGETLHGEGIKDLYRRIRDGNLASGDGRHSKADVLRDYIRRVSDDVRMERPLRVVIDCGNGIGGVCAADTLRAVGAEVLPLFDEVDGTFPNHHPDPSEPENLEDLIESVRLMDADLGLALDGDADRLGVVTLAGNIVYPDRVMMLLAMDVLDRNPGATIIYDVKCTGHLRKVIEEAGGKAVMYKTGHSLIKARMKELDAPFAGEMSGHFFFAERWYGVDDAIYSAARLLEVLSGTETPPEAIFNALPDSFSTPELKVQMKEGENQAFIDEFKRAARFEEAKISTIDGLRADFEDGWGLVRASNTTPVLVLRFDADSREALDRIKEAFRSAMLELRPDLDLPF